MATYGYPVLSELDPYVTLMKEVARITVKYSSPIVDFIPACEAF